MFKNNYNSLNLKTHIHCYFSKPLQDTYHYLKILIQKFISSNHILLAFPPNQFFFFFFLLIFNYILNLK